MRQFTCHGLIQVNMRDICRFKLPPLSPLQAESLSSVGPRTQIIASFFPVYPVHWSVSTQICLTAHRYWCSMKCQLLVLGYLSTPHPETINPSPIGQDPPIPGNFAVCTLLFSRKDFSSTKIPISYPCSIYPF